MGLPKKNLASEALAGVERHPTARFRKGANPDPPTICAPKPSRRLNAKVAVGADLVKHKENLWCHMDLPPLNALRAFEVAARTGSFIQAGSELGVTAAAVSLRSRRWRRTWASGCSSARATGSF